MTTSVDIHLFSPTKRPIPVFGQWLCGKAASGMEENCVENRLKELQESMDRCTGCYDITEMLKMALNTIQPINQSFIHDSEAKGCSNAIFRLGLRTPSFQPIKV